MYSNLRYWLLPVPVAIGKTIIVCHRVVLDVSDLSESVRDVFIDWSLNHSWAAECWMKQSAHYVLSKSYGLWLAWCPARTVNWANIPRGKRADPGLIRLMHRIVCAVNESLYYQMLCKGLVRSLIKYRSTPCQITVLLDGKNAQPLDDLREHLEIIPVQPFNMVCGSVSSRTTFARLEIPDLFPNQSRILYLDVDTFLVNPIDELFTLPFENLAAVVPGETLMIKEFLRRQFNADLRPMTYQVKGASHCCGSDDHKYFNAGVMLINPAQWRALRIKEHVQALTLAHPSTMYTSDVLGLNLILRGHLTQLESSFNTFACTEKSLTDRPRIWHFNQSKPILHTPLRLLEQWFSLFHRDDQRRLEKLADLSEKQGPSALLALLSVEYNKLWHESSGDAWWIRHVLYFPNRFDSTIEVRISWHDKKRSLRF